MALTKVSDVIVPEIFNSYVQKLTEEKSRLIQSGAVVRNPAIDAFLAGGGLTANAPSFQDLVNEDEDIVTDDAPGANDSTPSLITSANEIMVRLSRHKSWSSSSLAAALAGADPMEAVANLTASYWTKRLQKAFIATMSGVFANNSQAPIGSEHIQNDLTNDVSGTSYAPGVTDFSGAAFLDTAVTMGDSMESLKMLAVHSIVYNRMQKNNLIEYIPDARGETRIPTYLDRTIIVDDGMPNTGGVFESWLFGEAAVGLGIGAPDTPTEVVREAAAGQGGGAEVLHSRMTMCLHPVGHRYIGAAANGGPSNADTRNNLANSDSWQRAYPERKQIKIARLITREL